MTSYVLGFSGSPRGGANTNILVQEALGAAKEVGAKIQLIDLSELNLRNCAQDWRCTELGECAQDDDLNSVVEELKQADGIIFGAPSYYATVPTLMKNFIDRVGRFVNLRGKVGGAISVARRSGSDTVLQELMFFMYVKEMIIPGVYMWPQGFALHPGDIRGDTEAIEAAKELGKRVAILGGRIKEKALPWMDDPIPNQLKPAFGDDWR